MGVHRHRLAQNQLQEGGQRSETHTSISTQYQNRYDIPTADWLHCAAERILKRKLNEYRPEGSQDRIYGVLCRALHGGTRYYFGADGTLIRGSPGGSYTGFVVIWVIR
jgi:hypothetical protein